MSRSPASILVDGQDPANAAKRQAIDTSGRAAIQDQPNMDVALSTRATEATLAIRASEATLLVADGRLTTIDSVLDAIKDTDGVKKITDPLPAGTNEIGKVAQGTKAAAVDGWPQVLYDASGHAVGVVLDGAVYRLQAESKIARGASGLVHLDALDTTAGRGRLQTTLYTPDGDPVSFPSTSSSIKNEFVKSGGSDDLLVDGSVTPVVFEYLADSTYDISLQEIKFTLVANSLPFGSGYFGGKVGGLTTGMLVQVVTRGQTVLLYNFLTNEGFINFASPGGFDWEPASKDLLYSAFLVGGGLKLEAGTSDKVIITVRDNQSSIGVYFKCFVKGNLLGA